MTQTSQRVALSDGPTSIQYTLLTKRLQYWKKAEYGLRRCQLFKLLSFSMITLSLTAITFNALTPQSIPALAFSALCIVLMVSIVTLMWVTPLTNLNLTHRNELSKKLYEEDFYIEFSDSKILLINRCNSRIYCQMER
ncbi:hypothetical protein [Psychromonas sp. 14N.309.X.WAT.B.A12]|uniref:hypothetical protein n=1 Tax=unclassified Psychromonas TaxID=2614957 RepID=UPI0025B0C593|nr:hypothetical protein [Psychromonas sp. 14N.309.X.WAT.B.A12]MDN2661803.1 hypothetical protein [Psychromonas sp. 14N.309.X.WAT.B.A12]